MTLLHAIVRYDPPLDVVAHMIEICPEMPAAKDCLDRTPLHVAAGSGCPASLLNTIARAHPAACDAIDEEGKTPLHFVCDSSCVLFDEDLDNDENGGTPRQPPNHDAVSALLSHSFHAATLEDDEGMSPLEHVIMSNASMETVKLLQSATKAGMQLKNEVLQSFIAAAKRVDVSIPSSHTSSRPTKMIRRVTLNEFFV